MTAERVPMRKLREVIRMKLEMKLSGRAIARSCGLSPSTVSDYVGRISVAKLRWPIPPELDDEALSRLLFPQEAEGYEYSRFCDRYQLCGIPKMTRNRDPAGPENLHHRGQLQQLGPPGFEPGTNRL